MLQGIYDFIKGIFAPLGDYLIGSFVPVASSFASEIDSLPRLDVQVGTDRIRDQLRDAGLAGHDAGRRCVRHVGAHILGIVFRILPVDAVLHDDRQDEAGTGQGGLPWIRLK